MGTVAIPFVLSPDGIHSFPVTYMIYHNKWGSPETWSLWVLWHSFQIYVYYVRAYSSDAWQHAFVGMWFFSDIDIVSTRRFTWPITSTQYWPGGALVTFGHTWGIGRLLAAASQRMFLKLGSYSHAGLSHSKRVQICNSVISGILCHFQCRVQAGDWLCSCWNHQRGVYSRDLQSGFIRWHCHDAPEGSLGKFGGYRIGTRSEFQALHWSLGHGQLLCGGQERDRRLHTKKMKTLFEAADESGDGVIAPWLQEKNMSWAHPIPVELQIPPAIQIIQSERWQHIAHVLWRVCGSAWTNSMPNVCHMCPSHYCANSTELSDLRVTFKGSLLLPTFATNMLVQGTLWRFCVLNASRLSHLLGFRLTDWPVCGYILSHAESAMHMLNPAQVYDRKEASCAVRPNVVWRQASSAERCARWCLNTTCAARTQYIHLCKKEWGLTCNAPRSLVWFGLV